MNLQFITAAGFGLVFFVLFCAYVNSLLEKHREEREIQRRAFIEKMNRTRKLSCDFPAQFMTAELKALLFRIERGCVERLIKLGNASLPLKAKVEDLLTRIENAGKYVDENKVLHLTSEGAAQAARVQVQALHAVLKDALTDEIVTNAETQRWLTFLRLTMVKIYVEMFGRLAASQLSENEPRKAKLTVERALQYLNKQNTNGQFSNEIEQFKTSLELATNEVLRLDSERSPDEFNILELAESMLVNDEESWKKKAY